MSSAIGRLLLETRQLYAGRLSPGWAIFADCRRRRVTRFGLHHRPTCGSAEGHVAETGLYTEALLHPWVTGAILGAAGVAVATVLAATGGKKNYAWWRR